MPEIELKINDIIEVVYENTTRETYRIEYIDREHMILVSPEHPSLILWMNKGIIEEEGIIQINLLDRTDNGYALEHDLVPGTWMNIHLGGEVPKIVVAEIVDSEEDMIELVTYPEHERVYIDFEYRGLPKEISRIEIRDKPVEPQEPVVDTEEPVPLPKMEDVLHGMEIIFGETLDEIQQTVDVDEKKKRYSVEEQCQDLYDDLMNKVSIEQRKIIQKDSRRMVNRFKELRTEFSKTDHLQHITGILSYPDNYRPLVDNLLTLKEVPLWTIPVVRNVPKLYDIPGIDPTDYTDITIKTISNELHEATTLAEQYYNNINIGDDNKYDIYYRKLSPFFTPYEVEACIYPSKRVDAIVNHDQMKSPVTNGVSIQYKEGYMQSFIPEQYRKQYRKTFNVMKGDSMCVDTYVLRDRRGIESTRMFIPTTPIYRSAELSMIYNPYNTTIDPFHTITMDDPFDPFSFKSNHFDHPTHYVYEGGFHTHSSYLEKIIPTTSEWISMNRRPYFNLYQFIQSLQVYNILPSHVQSMDEVNMEAQLKKFGQEYEQLKNGHDVQLGLLRETYMKNYKESQDLTITPTLKDEQKDIETLYRLNKEQTSSEVLNQSTRVDQSRLLVSGISVQHTSMELTSNLDEVIRKELDQHDSTSSLCPIETLAKQYTTRTQLQYDNDREIIFDPQYDKIPYGFLDKYAEQKKTKTSDDYVAFVAKEILKTYKMSYADAVKESRQMMNGPGKRKVENGYYAMLMEDPPVYFKRVKNIWKEERVDSPSTFFCNMSDCIEKNGYCTTAESNKFTLKQSLLKNVLDEYQVTKYVSIENRTERLNEQYMKDTELCKKIKKIRASHIKRYNDEQVTIAKSLVPTEEKVDPLQSLLRRIMGLSDLEEKYTKIIDFVQQYTRHAIEEEDDHYLYNADTGMALLPVFIHTLAGAYHEGIETYKTVMEECKLKYGTLNDTGADWVDKKSGEIFDTMMLDTAEGYDEKGTKLIRAVIEEEVDADFDLSMVLNQFTPRQKEIVSVMQDVFDALKMTLPMDKYLFIVSQCSDQLEKDKNIGSREAFEKTKQSVSYETYYSRVLIFHTCTILFTVLQTSIPAKSRTTFTGCTKSFTGYPMVTTEDSGLNYMSCILSKIGQEEDPWKSLKGISQVMMLKYLRSFMDKFTMQNTQIQTLYDEKRLFLQTNIDIPKEHRLVDFLPPLDSVKSVSVSPVASHVIQTLTNDIRIGEKTQWNKIGVIEGKIIHLSMYILERIEDIISKEEPYYIVDNYRQNICCNESREGIREYLTKKDPSIYTTSTTIDTYSKSLDWIRTISRAKLLSFLTDTFQRPKELLPQYGEPVIYQAYIQLCKFNQAVQLDEELQTLCPNNKSSFLKIDSLKDKISIMKREGKQYNEESLEQLLNIQFRRNIIVPKLTTYIDKLVQFKEALEDSYIPKDIHETATIFLNTSTQPQLRNLKNALGTKVKEYKEGITEFMDQTGRSSRQTKKEFIDFSELLTKWNTDTKENSVAQYTHFLKAVVHRFCITYPKMILNHVNYMDTAVKLLPDHLKISEKHERELRDRFVSYYKELHSFYDNNLIDDVMRAIQERTKQIVVMSTCIPEVFDMETVGLWFEFFVMHILHQYIELTGDQYIQSTSSEVVEEDMYSTPVSTRKESIADLLLMYMRVYTMDKRVINIPFDKITEFMETTRANERKGIVESIGKLSAQERSSDKLLRKYKLGRWNAREIKGLITYSKETYDKDYENAVEDVDILNSYNMLTQTNEELSNYEETGEIPLDITEEEVVSYEGYGNDDMVDEYNDPYNY